jgi:acetyltransferase-like isoleucine patch superfamily enzyme
MLMSSSFSAAPSVAATPLTPVADNGSIAQQLARVPSRLYRALWLEVSTWPIVRPAVRLPLLRLAGVQVRTARIVDRIQFVGSNITIGDGAFINSGCYIETDGGVTIGAHASLGPRVSIITVTHEIGPEIVRAGRRIQGRVDIGVGAWIGANSTILPGVTIGRGAIVGAGSVVTKNVPDNVVVAGVPARVMREL